MKLVLIALNLLYFSILLNSAREFTSIIHFVVLNNTLGILSTSFHDAELYL